MRGLQLLCIGACWCWSRHLLLLLLWLLVELLRWRGKPLLLLLLWPEWPTNRTHPVLMLPCLRVARTHRPETVLTATDVTSGIARCTWSLYWALLPKLLLVLWLASAATTTADVASVAVAPLLVLVLLLLLVLVLVWLLLLL